MKFSWLNFFILVFLAHLGLVYILIWGSPIQIFTAVTLFLLECSFASTAVYHRLLSHRSWNASRRVEIFGTLLGVFTFTGTSITRTLSHRYHHMFTETDLDPHSPRVIGLLKTYFPMLVKDRKMNYKYVSDLIRDPFHRFIHRYYFLIIATVFVIISLGASFNWAVTVAVAPGALCWNNISICNIFCHLGKKNDIILNNKFLAMITFGEGWHKNHHLDQMNPNFGNGELDIGYIWVKLFRQANK